MHRNSTGGRRLILIDSAYLASREFIQETRHQLNPELIQRLKQMREDILISGGAPTNLAEPRVSEKRLKELINNDNITYISLNVSYRNVARSLGYRTRSSIFFLPEILDGRAASYVRISWPGGRSRSELLRRLAGFGQMLVPFYVTYERPPAVYGITTGRALREWKRAGFQADRLGKAGLPESTNPVLVSGRGLSSGAQAPTVPPAATVLWHSRRGMVLAAIPESIPFGARILPPLATPSRVPFSTTERRALRSLTAIPLKARLRRFALPNECRFHAPGNQAAVMLIRQQLGEIGLELAAENLSTCGPPGHPFFNVVGTLPGNAAGAIVIGCHLDSTQSRGGIHAPGADDNASGMAAVLCIAETVLRMRALAPALRCLTFHFAFFNKEEEHCLGSSEWLKKNPPREVRAMIQLDTIGYTPPGTRRPWDWQIHSKVFGDRPGMEVASTLLGAFLAASREELATRELLPPEPTVNPVRSDHSSFHTHHIPACCVSEALFPASGPGRNPHLHKSTDTIEHINFPYAAAIARVSAGAAWLLATR